MHDAPNALAHRRTKHDLRAGHVHAETTRRLLDAERHAHERSEVKHVATSAECAVHRRLVRDVALDQDGLSRQRRDAAGGQVVEHADLCASRDERMAEMSADEASAARDEHAATRKAPCELEIRAGRRRIHGLRV
jgi:hypothetical protein